MRSPRTLRPRLESLETRDVPTAIGSVHQVVTAHLHPTRAVAPSPLPLPADFKGTYRRIGNFDLVLKKGTGTYQIAAGYPAAHLDAGVVSTLPLFGTGIISFTSADPNRSGSLHIILTSKVGRARQSAAPHAGLPFNLQVQGFGAFSDFTHDYVADLRLSGDKDQGGFVLAWR